MFCRKIKVLRDVTLCPRRRGACIFRVKQWKKIELPWRWRHNEASKRRGMLAQRQGVISQCTWIFLFCV